MKECKKCVLKEPFPGVSLDDEGHCSYCRDYLRRQANHEAHEETPKKIKDKHADSPYPAA